jgi:hypothetical protein
LFLILIFGQEYPLDCGAAIPEEERKKQLCGNPREE